MGVFIRVKLKTSISWSLPTQSSTLPLSNLISAFNCSNKSRLNRGLGELGIYKNLCTPHCFPNLNSRGFKSTPFHFGQYLPLPLQSHYLQVSKPDLKLTVLLQYQLKIPRSVAVSLALIQPVDPLG